MPFDKFQIDVMIKNDYDTRIVDVANTHYYYYD